MSEWLVRRVAQAAGILVLMSILVFIGIHVVGDPVEMLVPPDASQQERARIVASLGLDLPLWRQYLDFLGGVVQGDFGRSFVYNTPALELVFSRMPATMELAFSALLMAILIGIPLGILAGTRPDSALSKAIMTVSIIGFSLPTFWVGLMFIMIFSVQLGVLPSTGRGETVEILGTRWSFLTADGLSHLVLPAVNLALFKVSMVLRLTYAGVRDAMGQDYVRFARAKGVDERRVIGVHVLRNILIPIVTVLGLEFGSVVAFAVVTETVFAWPGMGKLIIDSIYVLDRPVVVAYLMVIVALFVVINLIVDLLYLVLDPRMRLEAGQ